MAKHLVLGNGNLGQDLAEAIIRQNDSVEILSRSNGFEYPLSLPTSRLIQANYVWCTVGAGSVESAKEDFRRHLDLHVRLPVELSQRLPEDTRLILFSTDYLDEEGYGPRSLYALSKQMMEKALHMSGRKNYRIYRVGSLYGSHKPEECFPGKLMKRFREAQPIELPKNSCRPTPTKWLAQEVLDHQRETVPKFMIPEWTIAPQGKTTVHEWGSLILKDCDIPVKPFDTERPCALPRGNRFGWMDDKLPDWRVLWDVYGQEVLAR